MVHLLAVEAAIPHAFLLAVRRVVGAIEVQQALLGTALAARSAIHSSASTVARRSMLRRSTRFSSREKVDWLARAGSLSIRPPQTSLNKGAWRNVVASFWSA